MDSATNKATETQTRYRVKLANGYAYATASSVKEAMAKASETWGERAISAKKAD